MNCFKIIIVGESNVGKSCLLLQYTDQRFKNIHDTTIGIGFASKVIQMNDKYINLHIWDTAGQESFKSLTRSFYRGAIGCILVFDITNKQSFIQLLQWYQQIQSYACDQIELIIVGNKCDLNEKREVQINEGQQFAKQYKFEYIETSAKTGEGINQVFEQLIINILKKDKVLLNYQNIENNLLNQDKVVNDNQKKNNCC